MLQLASLEKRCMEKENEINDLRRRIIEKLEDEKQEKLEKEQEHLRTSDAKRAENLADTNKLGEMLMNLNKGD